jgi:hypothetical protein
VIKIHQASTTCFFHQSINQSCFSSLNQTKKERKESESTINHPNQMNEKKSIKVNFID